MTARRQLGVAAAFFALLVLLALSWMEIARLNGRVMAQERGLAAMRGDLEAALVERLESQDALKRLESRNSRIGTLDRINERVVEVKQRFRANVAPGFSNWPSRAYLEQVREQGALLERTSGSGDAHIILPEVGPFPGTR
jgi:hypothetical protein